MTLIPGVRTATRSGTSPLAVAGDYEEVPAVVLDSARVSDAGSSPTSRIRAGNVLLLAASGKFVTADDATAIVDTPATVTASETADGDWASATITVKVDNGDDITVTLGGSDDTDAEVVAALNANADFRALCKASVVASRVVITTHTAGAMRSLKVTSSLSTAFGTGGKVAYGTEATAVVTLQDCLLLDSNGAACDATVRVARAGYFSLSKLIVGGSDGVLETSKTASVACARAALLRQGSKFAA